MMNLKKYRDYIKREQDKMTIDDMAKHLGISTKIIENELKIINMKPKKTLRRFSTNEVNLINKYYKYLSYGELSSLMSRDRAVVYTKIKELGLDKKDELLEEYLKEINGFEDLIMFMYFNLGMDIKQIETKIKSLSKESKINYDMIDTFVMFNEDKYKKKWRVLKKISF